VRPERGRRPDPAEQIRHRAIPQLAALTSENSAVVMIDHAVGFGNVFRSHDLSLHVDNTVGLAKTAGVFGVPLVLTNGADPGPYGPLFSELRAVTGGARVIVRAGVVPVTWLSLAWQYQGSYTNHEKFRDSSA
jgi:hypothetical protein